MMWLHILWKIENWKKVENLIFIILKSAENFSIHYIETSDIHKINNITYKIV